MHTKIDLKKEWKNLYRPSTKKAAILEIPAANYLMIDGRGSPNASPRFQEAIEALYALSYGLKFAVRERSGIDYGVMPLEGLYWGTPRGQTTFSEEDKEKWSWTLLMLQPDWIDRALVEELRVRVRQKKNPSLIDEVRFERFDEGLVVQIRYIGPYDNEGETVKSMHAYAESQGYVLRGKHHEIYLNDFRRTAAERLQTVLRHPIEPAGLLAE